MFCVASPRFDVRSLNTPVDSSASSPARSRARMWRKKPPRKTAPATSIAAISATFVSAWRIPKTTKNIPTADRTAPRPSKGRSGSAGMGSSIRRLSSTIVATTSAWKTNAARQLMAVVMTPPMSGPAAAPMPPSPLMTPNAPRTDRDVPSWIVVAVPLAVVITLVGVPGLLAGNMAFGPRLVAALGVAIFGVCFVVVSSRIVGLVGVSSNPTSAMTLVTLLGASVVFVLCGWTDPSARAAILTVGTVVCIAASKAGDISQDLKTGFLVGATPAKQQFGQFLGAACACWAIAGTVLLLGRAFTFGSPELPAPQATLMKTVIEGVLSGSLPWALVGTGSALSICAIIAGLPGLSFAVGIYLPLGTLAPVFVGGIVRRMVDAKRAGKPTDSDPGVLAASGMIAGEGLVGVLIAFLIGTSGKFPALGTAVTSMHFAAKDFTHLTGVPAIVMGIIIVIGICALLYPAGRSAQVEETSAAETPIRTVR